VLLAVGATLLVHLLSLTRQLGPDEGGFAMVARFSHAGGPYLYGPSWVDRPPLLIGVFALAGHLGPYGVRLLATATAVALVATSAWTAEAVGGRPAARWAAWIGFALASSVLLNAQRLDGELVAALFVTVSIGCVLRSLHGSRGTAQAVVLGSVSGAAATCALLVKQNFVDGFVFAAVLVACGLATRRSRLVYRPRRVATTTASFTAGAVVPAAAAVVWAGGHGGVGALMFAMFGFRSEATGVMAHWSLVAPLQRMAGLALVGYLSGVLLLVVHLGWRHRHRLRRLDPMPWALAATVLAELVGVVGGANFWDHYLLALVPTVALATGLSVNRRMPGWRATRTLVVAAALVTSVVTPVAAVQAAQAPSAAYTIGSWVRHSARPADTIVVPFTHANVISASGLRPGYPFAWSLPVRTLDPHLTLFRQDLAGRSGSASPTWVIRWDSANAWGLDPHGRVDAVLHRRYQPVAALCGHLVWLRDGTPRHLAPLPSATACGPGDR
jgi:hypothetical protein